MSRTIFWPPPECVKYNRPQDFPKAFFRCPPGAFSDIVGDWYVCFSHQVSGIICTESGVDLYSKFAMNLALEIHAFTSVMRHRRHKGKFRIYGLGEEVFRGPSLFFIYPQGSLVFSHTCRGHIFTHQRGPSFFATCFPKKFLKHTFFFFF